MISKRLPLTHLAAIALTLAALAGLAWWYTNSREPVEGSPLPPGREAPIDAPEDVSTPEACEDAGGVWNPCASPCPPGAEACIQVCVERCEGLGDGETVAEVFFSNRLEDPNVEDCAAVFPVRRAVSVVDTERSVIEALLKGPTAAETDAGFFTSIPEDTFVKAVVVQSGIARVDLDGGIKSVAGSCRVTAIRAQIEETLKRFRAIQDVAISVDGEIEEALQP